jgi:F-type H+-transporting ATPase subunit b
MNLVLAAEPSGIELLPETPELIWGLVAFIILFLVMRKLVFPRLNIGAGGAAHAHRGQDRGGGRQARRDGAGQAHVRGSLGDARGEAGRILDEAKAAAESTRETILATAREEAQRIVERATADANAERSRLLEELRGQVGALSVQLAERIVERELDAATHSGLVDEYIQRLAARN